MSFGFIQFEAGKCYHVINIEGMRTNKFVRIDRTEVIYEGNNRHYGNVIDKNWVKSDILIYYNKRFWREEEIPHAEFEKHWMKEML